MSDDLLCLFTGQIEEDGDRLTIEIPAREVDLGPLQVGASYRVALLPAANAGHSGGQPSERTANHTQSPEPPVDEGEVVELEIEDLGDQGDGIARIDSGYVVVVPNTTLGERVTVEITDARDTMAFAEVIGRQDR
jgi:predicted RNA-binding protein with TRAM domain